MTQPNKNCSKCQAEPYKDGSENHMLWCPQNNKNWREDWKKLCIEIANKFDIFTNKQRIGIAGVFKIESKTFIQKLLDNQKAEIVGMIKEPYYDAVSTNIAAAQAEPPNKELAEKADKRFFQELKEKLKCRILLNK